jgi:glucans biosynthesis protein C
MTVHSLLRTRFSHDETGKAALLSPFGTSTDGRSSPLSAGKDSGDAAERSQPRWHHLDALRGLLMILGIFLHASCIYAVNSHWLIHDVNSASFFNNLCAFIHHFRLPCFFIISGMLSAVVIQRKGRRHFFRSRSQRLVLPLLATALLLNVAQAALVAYQRHVPLTTCLSGEGWISHLWFLVDLLVYCYLLLAVWPFLSRVHPENSKLYGPFILVLPLVSAALPALYGRLFHSPLIAGMLDGAEMVYYATFFFFGFLFQPGKGTRRDIILFRWSLLLLLISVLLSLFHANTFTVRYADNGLSWSLAILCLWFGKRFFTQASGKWKELSDAAYTIYLFHHIVVIGLGIALMSLAIPILEKFILIVLTTFLVTFWLHRHVIQRVPFLSLLFNGSAHASG